LSEKRTGTVVFHLDPLNPPTITAKELVALDEMPDEAIDYSDIPPLGQRRWTKPGAVTAPSSKREVTVSLDADIVDFFQSADKLDIRMNDILREYVDSQRKAS
jgi:uncharacterized protein (DUF4415 family)